MKSYIDYLNEQFNIILNQVQPRKREYKVIIADPCTIIIDGDRKTVVKASEEKFNPEKGVVMALLKHRNIFKYPKLKEMVEEIKNGDAELVIAKFLLSQKGITDKEIQAILASAVVQKKQEGTTQSSRTQKVEGSVVAPKQQARKSPMPRVYVDTLFVDKNQIFKDLNNRVIKNKETVLQKHFNKRYSELTPEELREYRRILRRRK